MTTAPFVHLHVHSHYSLLDGTIAIPDLVGAAKEHGMKALALTDHGNLFGAVQFYRKCREEGIKPIVGMEAYVAPGSRFDRKRTGLGAFTHFNLLARNAEGYRNLMILSSRSYLEGFYYKPRIDKDLLRAHSKGLIGLSACLSSEINRAAIEGTEEELRAQIETYRGLFEPGCFFLEIQRNGLAEQERIIERVPPVARAMGIPLVATSDVHYLRREDARAQEVHLCINTGQTMDDADRMRFGSEQFYFRSGEEMERVLGDFPEALANTAAVADLVDLDLDFKTTHLPRFEAEGITDYPAYLRHLCEDGLRARYPNFDRDPEIKKRLEYELSVIVKTGFVSYFLITWDFIRFARENDVPVGPGRGSAAGSLVAYALGITDVDPLRYDLLFERFLNVDRISMPDIDIDFCMEKRGVVIDYVKRKYGADRVCQIITFGTMAARAVIRDVGRALNMPLGQVDAIAKKLPAGPGVDLKEALEQEPELKAMAASDPKVKELFDISLRLEGLNRHASTHAAGVVIGDAPLIDLVPLYKNGEETTTQFVMEDLEACGLLKMDFLGLRNLTVIDQAVRLIEGGWGRKVDIRAIPLDDAASYELLCRGDTMGVFQLESNGMRDILRRLKPDRFEDIIAVLALYRPGPLGSGMVESYIRCKHGQEKITYDHPLLEPILKETNGVILYQEQVMRIANVLAGFSLTEADSLRKAMGKKKPAIMAKFQSKFVEGSVARGVDEKAAAKIWDLMVYFAGYGFNKSHSTAYAVVTYRTAWLKANYPTEFLAALMTCEMSNTDKLAEYLEDCRRLEIKILPPDINHSGRGFTVAAEKNTEKKPAGDAERSVAPSRRIWYGLEAIKGMGGKAVQGLVAERERAGPFASIFDLCERLEAGVLNKASLESLVGCGALDSLGRKRSQLAAVAEAALTRGARSQEDRRAGQTTLFDLFDGPAEGTVKESAHPSGQSGGQPGGQSPSESGGHSKRQSNSRADDTYPAIPEWPDPDRLSREKQALGFYLSGHPLHGHQKLVRKFGTHTLGQVPGLAGGTAVLIGALIAKLTKKVSKKTGDPFWIALVEDLEGSMEIFINAELYEAAKENLAEERLVFLRGSVRFRDTNASLNVDEIIPFEKAPGRLTTDLSVVVPVDDGPRAEELIFRLKSVLNSHRGECPVFIVFKNVRGERAVIQVARENYVTPDSGLLADVETLCGGEGYHLNRMRSQRA